MICRVCLHEAECPLHIFDANGKQLNISQIIETHLWFKPLPKDSMSTVICRLCWFKIDEFHKFYICAKQAHLNLGKTLDSQAEYDDNNSDELEIKDEMWHEPELSNPLYEPEVILKSEKDENECINQEQNCLDTRSLGENKTKDVRSIKKLQKKKTNRKGRTNSSAGKKSPLDDDLIKKYIKMGCDLCTFVGEDFDDMRTHFRTGHDGVRPYVMCCGRKLNKRVFLVQHAYKHKDPEYYKCVECSKVFSDGYNLRSHMLASHAQEDELKYQCDQCPKKFSRLHLLTLHKPSHIPLNERSFICEKCTQPKAFASQYLLQIHIHMQHIKATNVCHVCAKEIRDDKVFKKHVRLHFEDSGPRVKCPRPDCDQWLKDEDNLKRHMRRHADEGKTFTCDTCGKTTKNGRSLKSHISYAHSKEVHSCGECQKTFKSAITLKEHMAQHTGETLYKCPFCVRTFNSNANMHSHKKKMHPMEWDLWRKTKRGSSQSIINK